MCRGSHFRRAYMQTCRHAMPDPDTVCACGSLQVLKAAIAAAQQEAAQEREAAEAGLARTAQMVNDFNAQMHAVWVTAMASSLTVAPCFSPTPPRLSTCMRRCRCNGTVPTMWVRRCSRDTMGGCASAVWLRCRPTTEAVSRRWAHAEESQCSSVYPPSQHDVWGRRTCLLYNAMYPAYWSIWFLLATRRIHPPRMMRFGCAYLQHRLHVHDQYHLLYSFL